MRLLFLTLSFTHNLLITFFTDGIAAATLGSVMNYLLLSFAPQLDRFYLHSFEILLACTVVFPGIGNVGYTLLEYRLGQRGFFGSFLENIRWVPFFLFFFGGLSIHLSTAMLAHLFSYDMCVFQLAPPL